MFSIPPAITYASFPFWKASCAGDFSTVKVSLTFSCHVKGHFLLEAFPLRLGRNHCFCHSSSHLGLYHMGAKDIRVCLSLMCRLGPRMIYTFVYLYHPLYPLLTFVNMQ